MLGTLIAMHLLAGYKSEVRAIVKLRNIVQRLNASIQVESDNTFGLEWEKLKPQIKNRKSRNIMPATAQEIEYDLIEVLDLIVGEKRKIVIIFDELDKTDSAKRHEHSETLPEFEKLSVRPEQKVSSRTRKQEVLRIIANMKFFFSTARAYFIFIAGREMYEAYQADMSDRDFSISSIFSGVINVDSFLTKQPEYQQQQLNDRTVYMQTVDAPSYRGLDSTCSHKEIRPEEYLLLEKLLLLSHNDRTAIL